jgi:nitroimidazol reductase NimA-like FMN-containing flavoprotein (pyridoxamine 5'-phosphate oxidase superfamily)
VNFGYADGAVYFHSAPEGRKIALLREGRPVCVEIEADVEVVLDEVACRSTTRYRSLIAYGRASFLEGREAKRDALRLIVRQCGGEAAALPDAAVDAVAVVRVRLDEASGKRSPA